jgi:NADP-dependent 3-hydroxy acid dehydrogenase YdfG
MGSALADTAAMQPIYEQVVVITGASSGIGRAVALEFAARRGRLVLAARDERALESVAGECRTRGADAVVVPTDVTDESAVFALRDAAVARHGRIDIWVNDAAVYALGRFEDTPSDVFRRILETNVLGVVHGSKAALGQFRIQGTGRLINMGSSAGLVPFAEASAYCASKHGVHAITEIIRQELVGTDIHASLVAPATVDTPLFQHAANYTYRDLRAMPPIYTPERVARAVVACARRPKRIVRIGSMPRFMQLNRSLMPGVFERTQLKLIEKNHLGQGLAGPSHGNLYGPIEPHSIDGGWDRKRGRNPGTAMAALAALASLVMLRFAVR